MPPNDMAVPASDLRLDFHPARLAALHTAPSPLGRILLWGVCLFAVLALLWAVFGTVDVVAVGQGKLIPTGKVKVVQAPEAGVVRAIHVRDGDRVREGDPLIELDATAAFAAYDQIAEDLRLVKLDRARLMALSANPRQPEATFRPPTEARPEMVALARRLMAGRAAEYRAQADAAQAELARRRGEARSLQAQIAKLEASIPLLAKRVEAKQTLTDKGYGASMPLLEIKQQLSDQEHDLDILKTRRAEVEGGVQAAEAQLRRIHAEYQRSIEAELSEVEKKFSALQQDHRKAEQRLHYQTLTAPADGSVQQLAVNTIGGVLTQGQTAMMVVPADTRLEVEAMLLNKDIGFVVPGQRAVIKLETFNFTRYGFLEGTVLHVSRDAIEDKSFGLVYAARISLDAEAMEIDGRPTALGPGMSAVVEIKTDRRRIIDFVLAPLVRYQQESLRER